MSNPLRLPFRGFASVVLGVTASLVAACGTPTGSERGPCYGNGTCNAGLTCVSQICVRDTTGDGSIGDATDVPRADSGTMDVPVADTPATDAATDSSTDDTAANDATSDAANDTTSTDAPVDSPITTDGGGCTAAGVECSGYATVLATAARGATSIDNCVVQLHQTDCCGARRAYGINHGSRSDLCTAETACTSMYPTPASCSDGTITTDSGETTTNTADVKLRVVSPTPCSFDPTQTCYTCETFVCTTGSCRTAPGIAGGCGG